MVETEIWGVASDLRFFPNFLLPHPIFLRIANGALLDEVPVLGHDELEVPVEIAVYVALGRVSATEII